jgi:inorganic triphosphatase YgiF
VATSAQVVTATASTSTGHSRHGLRGAKLCSIHLMSRAQARVRGQALTRLIDWSGWTLDEIAQKAGVSLTVLWKAARGLRPLMPAPAARLEKLLLGRIAERQRVMSAVVANPAMAAAPMRKIRRLGATSRLIEQVAALQEMLKVMEGVPGDYDDPAADDPWHPWRNGDAEARKLYAISLRVMQEMLSSRQQQLAQRLKLPKA